MAGRRTNLALLIALGIALSTGVVAFALGSGAASAVVVAHGAAGVAVVVLAPWKQQIIRRGLGRRRPGRRVAILLGGAVAITVASGFAHAAGVTSIAMSVTAMQVHVAAALVVSGLFTRHLVTRWVRPRRTDLGRRSVVRAAGLAAAAGVGWSVTEGAIVGAGLPGADRRFTGSHERGSQHPDQMPVTQWLFDTVPQVNPATWRLTVRTPAGTRAWALPDLRAAPHVTHDAVLDCTGGWYAHQSWTGIPLRHLLGDDPAGRRIVVTSITGYTRALPVVAIDDLILALVVGGIPLSAGHGFPARLIAPGRRGFWWVKWVQNIGVDDVPWWVAPPFPAQ